MAWIPTWGNGTNYAWGAQAAGTLEAVLTITHNLGKLPSKVFCQCAFDGTGVNPVEALYWTDIGLAGNAFIAAPSLGVTCPFNLMGIVPNAEDIHVVYTDDCTNDIGHTYITNITNASFDVNVHAAPGSALPFNWYIRAAFGIRIEDIGPATVQIRVNRWMAYSINVPGWYIQGDHYMRVLVFP